MCSPDAAAAAAPLLPSVALSLTSLGVMKDCKKVMGLEPGRSPDRLADGLMVRVTCSEGNAKTRICPLLVPTRSVEERLERCMAVMSSL